MLPSSQINLVNLLLLAVAVVNALLHGNCEDYLIPIRITAPYYELALSINSDWDVVDYIFNSTRRDSSQTFKPIVGNKTETATYTIGATFCAPESTGKSAETVLVLTAGSMVDRSYWNPVFNGSAAYNFVQHALYQGYSVFFYDRLGTGKSDRPDPITHVQFAPQVEILSSLVKLLKQPSSPYVLGTAVGNIVHVGHSLGSFVVLATVAAKQTPVLGDAAILTGYSGLYDWLGLFTSGGQARIAALELPGTWPGLPNGYLVPVDVFSAAYGGFKTPYFDHAVAEWLYGTQQPFAIGEILTAATIDPDLSLLTIPVQVVQGRYDLTACGGFCDGVLNTTASLFPNATSFNINGSFNAGHMLNYHYDAKRAFQAITDFIAGVIP